MSSRTRRWLRSPVFLLALVAGLSAFVIQSGELGTADTTHRLQAATWLWTSEPQVFPAEYPEFGCTAAAASCTAGMALGSRC